MAEYDSVDPSQTVKEPIKEGYGTAGNERLIVFPEAIIQPAISILKLLYVPESNAEMIILPFESAASAVGPTEVPSSV